jgi:hypothetical protein
MCSSLLASVSGMEFHGPEGDPNLGQPHVLYSIALEGSAESKGKRSLSYLNTTTQPPEEEEKKLST